MLVQINSIILKIQYLLETCIEKCSLYNVVCELLLTVRINGCIQCEEHLP